ncbi:MFS transporter [Clostridium saudiense]|uniref:MFS transporter n=1 Tax=Clostridium saudiense TaxID=1414720 RepID=A0ABS2FDU2_9CLOT|nr:glycoside-pentoside-hexuronide (GPH):cation symporter [Clostridium saudiense]MBM6818156.1 MFS transporter [Clostridium saudiense]
MNTIINNKINKSDDISIKTLSSYAAGSLGNNIIFSLINTYLLIFLTDSFGIGAAAVGTLFLVARIIDGITDPIMGVIVDNTNTKIGKSRPYLFAVPIFISITTIMCFSTPDLSYSNKIIWMYASYILWGISFTAMDIPYWSLSANITRSSEGKTKIVTSARTIAYVGGFTISTLTIPLVSALKSWTKVAIIYAVFASIFIWITALGVKELNTTKTKKEKQGFKQFVNLLKTNKPLRIVLLSMLVLELSGSIKNTISIYYIKYNFNAEMMIPVVTSVTLVASILGGLISPYLTKKLGKRNTALLGLLVTALGAFLIFSLSYSSLYAMIAINFICGIFDGAGYITLTSMVADCVEYGEWQTGKRSEGMIFSLNIFKSKISNAIGGALCGYILAYIGYNANSAQSAFTLNGIHIMQTLIPCIIIMVSFLLLKRYNLSEAEYDAIVDDLRNGVTRISE